MPTTRLLKRIAASLLSLACSCTTAVSQEILTTALFPHSTLEELQYVHVDGDFNGDGVNDLLFSRWHVFDRTYKITIFDVAHGRMLFDGPLGEFKAYDDSIAVADFNRDGFSEIFINKRNPSEYASDGCFFIYDGKDSHEIYRHIPPPDRDDGASYCFDSIQLDDLDNDGQPEIVASLFDKPDQTDVLVLKYSAQSNRFAERCRAIITPDSDGTVASFSAGPDRNGNGWRDVFLGFPSADNDGGSIVIIDGSRCGVIAEDRGFPLGTQAGLDVIPAGDMHLSNKMGVLARGAESAFLYSGTTGQIVSTLPVPSYQSAVGVSDLNRDGFPDLLRNVELNLTLISGGTGATIGNLAPANFISRAKKLLPSIISYPNRVALRPSGSRDKRFDINRDGTPDFVAYTRGLEFSTEVGVQRKDAFFIISGSCPLDLELETTPQTEWSVPEGTSSFSATASVCGLKPPAAYEVHHGGQKVPLHDDGQNGDTVPNDGTYSTLLDYFAGKQNLKLLGVIGSEPLVTSQREFQLSGTQSYYTAVIPYTWFDTSHATDLGDLSATGGVAEIRAPFPIKLFEGTSSQFLVSSSGFLLEGSKPVDYLERRRLPNISFPGRIIAPFWGPLQPRHSSRVAYMTTSVGGSRWFVVSWEGFQYIVTEPYPSPDSSYLTFQVAFQEQTGNILMNYQRTDSTNVLKDEGAAATSGIQDNAILGTTFSHNEAKIPSRTSVLYLHPSSQGGGTNPDPSPPLKVALSVKYSPARRSATVGLLTANAVTGSPLDLSAVGCLYDLFATSSIPKKSLTLQQVVSVSAGSGRVAKVISNLPGMSYSFDKDSHGKRAPIAGYVAARVRCPDGRTASTAAVRISPPARYQGRRVSALAWSQMLMKALAKVIG